MFKGYKAMNYQTNEPIILLPQGVKILCLVNILAFILLSAISYMNPEISDLIMYKLSFVPARYFSNTEPFGIEGIYSLITHMFVHAGLLHLSVNLVTLMAFGTAIERSLGTKKFFILYFTCGIAASLTYGFIYGSSVTPMVGASGAISALFGAVMAAFKLGGMYKNVNGFALAIGLFIFSSFIFGVLGVPGAEGEIAWVVHIAGFVYGLLAYLPIKKLSSLR